MAFGSVAPVSTGTQQQGFRMPDQEVVGKDESIFSGALSGAAAGTAVAPGWGTVIGAGIGLLGGVLGNQASAKSAREQMRFQERMANTAHQREVADLRAAGLNPVLSGTGGAGSATPQGAKYEATNVGESTVAGAKAGFQADMDRKLVQMALYEKEIALWQAAQNFYKTGDERSVLKANEANLQADSLWKQQQVKGSISTVTLQRLQMVTERERAGLISKERALIEKRTLIAEEERKQAEYNTEVTGYSAWDARQQYKALSEFPNADIRRRQIEAGSGTVRGVLDALKPMPKIEIGPAPPKPAGPQGPAREGSVVRPNDPITRGSQNRKSWRK